jgi:hypothetical protein
MKKILLLITTILLLQNTKAYTKTIHVFVALCDNEFQGIVPVPDRIGNGKDYNANLYWGCGYGVRSFFKLKTKDWTLVKIIPSNNPYILERILFKHATKDAYILADAYDGEQIKACTIDFLEAANDQNLVKIAYKNKTLNFGAAADLAAYIGHDGLMDFGLEMDFKPSQYNRTKDVIILACYSKEYFKPYIEQAGANPVLWTTHLMAPEAYTLKAALDGWLLNETGKQIDERAAQAYNKYQKCGIKGARNLFTTGY